jgi:hypothetical protein
VIVKPSEGQKACENEEIETLAAYGYKVRT